MSNVIKHFTISADEAAVLTALAAKEDHSFSWIVRHLLRLGYQEYRRENQTKINEAVATAFGKDEPTT